MAEEVGMRLKLLLIVALTLALLLFSSPVAADDFTPWTYDSNYDGIMSKSEALAAVADYFSGWITKANALEVIAKYYADNDLAPASRFVEYLWNN